ncbi:hypothetical protein FB567DRAFT_586116 [Paraphoma chrysanthemicola]|uniref:Uncharacterized protein n=1 Tax=Paraphoma chrysanthemicola TaxID=798071 RepID=A0A8K0W3M3_9PLEO|nr:hypothetical protein FB567DRAFT_586116 [Paraphoma chrysanthemicola]
MRFSIPVLAFAATALAAPAAITSDCESLKSLSILEGAQIFCAEKFPAAVAEPVAGKPVTNAKRFKQDDERVVRILGGMPESRQKAFCACFPAVASVSAGVSVSATPLASASATSVTVSSTPVVSASATPSPSAI